MDATFLDEPCGFGWVAAEPPWMERTSHALVHAGGVWLVDPVDVEGLDARIAAAGEPRAVLQLLDRHTRDCRALAGRLGVPLLTVPDVIHGSPFRPVRVPGPWWRETALWWEEPRVLVTAEALGTVRYYRAPGEPLGVHPFLRVFAPPRVLLGLEPEHLLVGHGEGLHTGVPDAIDRAVGRARRDLPRVLPRLATARRG